MFPIKPLNLFALPNPFICMAPPMTQHVIEISTRNFPSEWDSHCHLLADCADKVGSSTSHKHTGLHDDSFTSFYRHMDIKTFLGVQMSRTYFRLVSTGCCEQEELRKMAIFTALTMKNAVFWDVTSCSSSHDITSQKAANLMPVNILDYRKLYHLVQRS
jgi:hypothetical protein